MAPVPPGAAEDAGETEALAAGSEPALAEAAGAVGSAEGLADGSAGGAAPGSSVGSAGGRGGPISTDGSGSTEGTVVGCSVGWGAAETVALAVGRTGTADGAGWARASPEVAARTSATATPFQGGRTPLASAGGVTPVKGYG